MDRDRFKRKPVSTEAVPPRQAPAPSMRQSPAPQPSIRPELLTPTELESIEVPAQVPLPVQPAETAKIAHPTHQAKPKKTRRQPAKRLKEQSTKLIISEIALVLALTVGLGYAFYKPSKPVQHAEAGLTGLNTSLAANSSSSGKASVNGTVPYTPVVPSGKPNLAKLGASAYNSQYGSYSFDDTYLDKPIRVSQQQLPSGKDTAESLIDKISASLKAGSVTPMSIQNGQPAYMLNNTDKTGKQVVVFTTKGMLLFVQSSTEHSAAEWANYLNSFQ